MPEDPIIFIFLTQFEAFKLVNKHVTTSSIGHKQVVGFSWLLRRGIELLK